MTKHCIICTGNVIKSSHKGVGTNYDSRYELCYKHYKETRQFIDNYLPTKDKTSAWALAMSITRDLYLANQLL